MPGVCECGRKKGRKWSFICIGHLQVKFSVIGKGLFWKFVVSRVLRLKMKDIGWAVVWDKYGGSRNS